MNWRFLNSGFSSGKRNMEMDLELADHLAHGEDVGTVRVYGWKPHAISLGWNQSLDDIQLDETRAAGIDVVRRPTGGRAILHAEELTYSVVMLAATKSIAGIYNRISLALVHGLTRLGIEASLERSQPHFPTLYRRVDGLACFASAAKNEIKVGGKKLVGSAQRRFARNDGLDVVLQHGSILMGSGHRRISQFLYMDERQKALLSQRLKDETTDVSSLTGTAVGFDDVAESVRWGFEQAWGITFEKVERITTKVQ